MSEWYCSGRRVYHGESAFLVATAERPEWAREIAALPDLLAALEEMLADAETMNEPYRNEAICERARTAIAKAKGL